jgi:drug/metabolite transporter (DMT)-like permease
VANITIILSDLSSFLTFAGEIYENDMSSKIKGLFFGVVAAATYGMNPLFTIPLYGDGMNVGSVLFFRYTLAAVILSLIMLNKKISFRLTRRELLTTFSLGMLMGLSSLTLFISYLYMDSGIASTLLFFYPLMVTLLMTIIYKEKVSARTWICLAVAMAGVVMLIFGKDGQTLSLLGVLLVLVSSLTYASYLVGVNKTCVSDMPTVKLSFYVISFGAMLFTAVLCVTGGFAVPQNHWLWLNVLALAMLPTAVSLVTTSIAIQNVGSTVTAILGVFEPVTALVFGVLVFGETINGREAIGRLLIMAAVCAVIAFESAKERKK